MYMHNLSTSRYFEDDIEVGDEIQVDFCNCAGDIHSIGMLCTGPLKLF